MKKETSNSKQKTGIVIQARKGSTRLPNKMVMPFYNGKGLLEIVIEKIKQRHALTPIVLATTDNPMDDELEEIAKKSNILCIRGSEEDVLSRFITAGKQYQFDNMIRVCADNPFLDITHIKELIQMITQNDLDYVSYQNEHQTPVIKTHLGLFTEAVSLQALQKVNEYTDKSVYKEHVTNYIYQNAEHFNVKLIDLPEYFANTDNVRLTLDTIEDFNLEKELYSKYRHLSTKELISIIKKDRISLELMQKNIMKNTK